MMVTDPRPRVGITQRAEIHADRREVRDALEARLASVVWDVGALPLPLPNGLEDVESYLDALDPHAFILSGGGDIGTPAARARVEDAVLARARARHIPVLGICRGMQAMLAHCGGRLIRLEGHVGGRHRVRGPGHSFDSVNSYHEWGIIDEGLPDEFRVEARADDGSIEAVTHVSLPWTGVMWHPEREDATDDAQLELVRRAILPEAPRGA